MTCPHCQAPLVDGARFCPACGKATAPTESGTGWQAANAAPDLVGREIAGRYRIMKKLGEGGMGAVYRGEQISLKRSVAVKVLRPELGSNQMILRRFNAEAEAVAKLSHPNTVNIFDFGQDSDGSLYIAMEFIEGRSLRETIQQEGPFPVRRALAIAQQVAASLSDAHSHSIVHRDLKPDNVMLQDRGKQRDVVRVLDFGIAKLRDDSRATQAAMTQAGDMLGTPQYMAPEQIKGEAIDGRTDIYALGCMIYEMVTGRLPYEAPTIMAMLSKHLMEDVIRPSQRRPDLGLSPAIDQLVLSAMAKEPAMRPATMDQFSEMLDGLLATLPADSNRSGGMSMQQGAVGPLVTPVANSVFAAPAAFTPSPGYPTPNVPPGYPTPSAYSAPTPAHQGQFAPPGAPLPVPQGFPPAPVGQGAYVPPPIAPTAMVSPHEAPYQQHHAPHQAPQMMSHAPAPASRAPLFAVLGVLLLVGGGVGVWAVMRDKGAKPSTAQKTDPDDATDEPTPSPVKEPTTPDPGNDPTGPDGDGVAGKDLWAGDSPGGTAAKTAPITTTPKAGSVGTAETPIPAGARIVPPAGFSKLSEEPKAVAYVNSSRGLVVAMASLYAGTNDPAALAKLWARDSNAELMESDTIYSHGANRPALAFTATVENVKVVQVIALYISNSYRLGVLYQAPLEMFADVAFQAEVEAFFKNNVKLP